MTPVELQQRVVLNFLRGSSVGDIALNLGELPYVVENVIREAFILTAQCVRTQTTPGDVSIHG